MKKYARKEFQLKEDSSQLYPALLFIQVIMSPVQTIALRPCTHSTLAFYLTHQSSSSRKASISSSLGNSLKPPVM